MSRFDGKVVLVTGAGSGIGEASFINGDIQIIDGGANT